MILLFILSIVVIWGNLHVVLIGEMTSFYATEAHW